MLQQHQAQNEPTPSIIAQPTKLKCTDYEAHFKISWIQHGQQTTIEIVVFKFNSMKSSKNGSDANRAKLRVDQQPI